MSLVGRLGEVCPNMVRAQLAAVHVQVINPRVFSSPLCIAPHLITAFAPVAKLAAHWAIHAASLALSAKSVAAPLASASE